MPQDEVLIIGAGPSGLFAAAELVRHGVSARIIERDLAPHRQARATSIQPGTLEILESIGLLPAFLEASERIRCSRLYGPDMLELASMSHHGIDCCCDFQCSLPQYETQRILEEHLTALGGVVERGVHATSVQIDGEAPVVELTHAGGRVETVRPRFLIGAGGAHSVTRHAMNESLAGTTYRGSFLVADIAMPAPMPREEAGVVCSPHGLLLLAPLPGGRWICFQDLEDGVDEVSPEGLAERVALRLGGKYRPSETAWIAPFRMHRRIVSRLSHGRCFLIGDAAHLSSPFGGEGLNAGLHDGFNLAWKLALRVRGQASHALIDGYNVERRIADDHVLAVSDEVHQSIVEMSEAVRQGQNVQPAVVDPFKAALIRNARAMIDVDYAGSPLIVDHIPGQRSTPGPHPGQWYPDWPKLQILKRKAPEASQPLPGPLVPRPPGPRASSHHALLFGRLQATEALARFPRKWSHLVDVTLNPSLDPTRAGLPFGGLALIRPDGHIAFRNVAIDDGAFEALDRHLESYLIPQKTNESMPHP